MENKPRFYIAENLYAGQNQRMANYLIDSVFQMILVFIVFFLCAFAAFITKNTLYLEWIVNKNMVNQYFNGLLFMFVYYNSFEILFGTTMGKLFTGTVLVNETGEKPKRDVILMRTLCRAIPFEIVSFLGFPCRGWHDSLSGTYVVDRKLLEAKKKNFKMAINTKYRYKIIGYFFGIKTESVVLVSKKMIH